MMLKPIIFLKDYGKENFNAGFKARKDACDIIDRLNFKDIDISFTVKDDKSKLYKLINYALLFFKLSFLKRNTVIIVQYPCRKVVKLLKAFKSKFKTVAIIHDIESLRFKENINENEEISNLNFFNVLITHNVFMTEKIKKMGVVNAEFVELNIFDYLYSDENNQPKSQGICFAGNIDKSGFIRNIPQNLIDYGVKLYGVKSESLILNENIKYLGAYDSDKIVSVLDGKFALLWDGDSADTCNGITGEYLRYNNPHKLSLYIAAKIPVIIWKDAATAKFVSDNKIGIAVKNLDDAVGILKNIDEKRYNEMLKNISIINNKIKNGEFLKSAVEKALKIIEQN